MKRTGMTASKAQREKVRDEGRCRICLVPSSLDPAHVTPTANGGCHDPLCVIPLCRADHRLYDGRALDVLPVLTREEQAHAVNHVGIVTAYQRTTNSRIPA